MPQSIATTTTPPTIIAFITKKPDISFQDFKNYYINNHIPYFLSLVNGQQHITNYVLHFAPRTDIPNDHAIATAIGADGSPGTEPWEYDAIARVVYKDQASFETVMQTHAECYEEISADEKKFLDQGRMKALVMGGRDGGGESVEFVM